MLKNKKLLPRIIIIAVATIAVIIAAIFIVRATVKSNQFNKALQTANDYLTNLDYESAIASYKSAIEINPNNVEAYLGLADAYIGLEDYDSAISVLNDGLAVLPDNSELTSKATEVQTLVDAQIAEEQKLAEYEEELAKDTQEISDEAQESSEDENTSEETIDLENSKWVVVKANCSAGDYTIYEYDDNGNNTKTIHYCSDGTLSYEDEYEYDNYGQTIKSFNNGTLSYEYENEYDENNNMIKKTAKKILDDNFVFRIITYVYEYDEEGKLIAYTVNNTIENQARGYECATFEYNDIGQQVKITYSAYDSLANMALIETRFSTFEYDDYGNKIKSTEYNSDGSISFITTYEYELIQISE